MNSIASCYVIFIDIHFTLFYYYFFIPYLFVLSNICSKESMYIYGRTYVKTNDHLFLLLNKLF